MSEHVQGRCPMGCGNTLFLGAGGYVTCGHLECPRPDAVSDILEDATTDHIVELKNETFTVRHPLNERLDNKLMECDLDTWLNSHDESPAPVGKYSAFIRDDEWVLSPQP